MVAQKVVSSHVARGLWENKVRSIRIDMKDHVTDRSVWIGGYIIHESGLHFFRVLAVGFDCFCEILFRAKSMVGSTAQA